MKLFLFLMLLLALTNFISSEIIFSDNPDNVFIAGQATEQPAASEAEETGRSISSFSDFPPSKSAPNKFFYIGLSLKKDLLDAKEDLVAFIEFKNFGNSSSTVDLIYQIVDSNKTVLHREKEFAIVKKDLTITKTFSNLNIKGGNYYLLLTASYNQNITYNLAESFAVEPLSLGEFFKYILIKKPAEIAVISLLIIGVFLYSLLLRKLRFKKGKNQLLTVNKNFQQ
jgi:hypothetical protein